MRAPRIHLPVPLQQGSLLTLDETAFNHVVRVLRLKPGAPLILFNGEGGEFHAVLERVERRQAAARVQSFVAREAESPLKVLLAQGVSKGERMDYALQKAVELGVYAVQPLLTERSVVSLEAERQARRTAHWRKIVAAACEQCGRNRLPAVLEPVPLRPWLDEQAVTTDLKLVLDPQAEHGLKTLAPPAGTLVLLIGPEGGLSSEEIAAAKAGGFTGIRLGPRIMRTETAAAAALATVQMLWGDMA